MVTTLEIYRGGRWQPAATLAPFFDFAPMCLDPEGIARVCRWSGDVESAGDPEWGRVIELFPDRDGVLRGEIRIFGQRLRRLPDIMHGGNPTVETLNKIGRPFGYSADFVPGIRKRR